MDAQDLIRMGHPTDLRTQLFWAASQRRRTPGERLLLYELVRLGDGKREVHGGPVLLSGLTGIAIGSIETILSRLERDGVLQRHQRREGDWYIELAFPPPDTPNAPQSAHVRAQEGR